MKKYSIMLFVILSILSFNYCNNKGVPARDIDQKNKAELVEKSLKYSWIKYYNIEYAKIDDISLKFDIFLPLKN